MNCLQHGHGSLWRLKDVSGHKLPHIKMLRQRTWNAVERLWRPTKPYRGTAQSTLDLLEGRVEMQFGTIPPTLMHIRTGKLRALAVTGATRNQTLPDVPTLAESGLEGYECSLWQAIVAPAAAPPAIVARLNREVGAVLDDPDVRAALAKNGIEAEASSPSALGARIRADVTKWRDVIASAGIRANSR